MPPYLAKKGENVAFSRRILRLARQLAEENDENSMAQ